MSPWVENMAIISADAVNSQSIKKALAELVQDDDCRKYFASIGADVEANRGTREQIEGAMNLMAAVGNLIGISDRINPIDDNTKKEVLCFFEGRIRNNWQRLLGAV